MSQNFARLAGQFEIQNHIILDSLKVSVPLVLPHVSPWMVHILRGKVLLKYLGCGLARTQVVGKGILKKS